MYLDDSHKMEQEFSWLYKTWLLHSLDKEYDIVVYYNPSAEKIVNKFPGIIAIAMQPVRMSSKYPFLNSHYFCLKEYRSPLQQYDLLLKTDCDVFLTKNIKNYTPYKTMIGMGRYYDPKMPEKISFIKKISSDLGFGYNNMANIGASFYGKTEYIVSLVSIQAKTTEFILNKYFVDSDVHTQSGFKKGISSMIGGEVAVNHCFDSSHVNLYTLDSFCEDNPISSDVIHIHAWHTKKWWSKHSYFEGKYDNIKIDFKDAFKTAGNYCHWIATSSMDGVMSYRDMLKKI